MDMGFRENLREAIDYSGLQQKELAFKTQLSVRNIQNYVEEKEGKKAAIPSAEYAVRLAQALGVTVEYLVTGKNPSDKIAAPIDPEIRKLMQVLKDLPKDKRRIVIENALQLAGIIGK